VLAISIVVTIASAHYATTHFQINTKTRNFIADKLPWRQNMIEMDRAFPQSADQIIVVIDGKTPEFTEAAAQRLNWPRVLISFNPSCGRMAGLF
jgi:uncharacterized protein